MLTLIQSIANLCQEISDNCRYLLEGTEYILLRKVVPIGVNNFRANGTVVNIKGDSINIRVMLRNKLIMSVELPPAKITINDCEHGIKMIKLFGIPDFHYDQLNHNSPYTHYSLLCIMSNYFSDSRYISIYVSNTDESLDYLSRQSSIGITVNGEFDDEFIKKSFEVMPTLQYFWHNCDEYTLVNGQIEKREFDPHMRIASLLYTNEHLEGDYKNRYYVQRREFGKK